MNILEYPHINVICSRLEVDDDVVISGRDMDTLVAYISVNFDKLLASLSNFRENKNQPFMRYPDLDPSKQKSSRRLNS